MINWFWSTLAAFCARPRVFAWLFARAERTPYFHLKRDAATLYMARYWLFNGYTDNATHRRRWAWLPSIRIHYIAQPDAGPPHDHPWDARSIILKGWYIERRASVAYIRQQGQTSTLKFGEFHKIEAVAPSGCWTMFILWKRQGSWGFKG